MSDLIMKEARQQLNLSAAARPLVRGLLDTVVKLCSAFFLASVCTGLLGPGSASQVLSHRVGTGFSFDNVQDFAAMQELSWWYDWGTEPKTEAREFAQKHEIEYVPMQVCKLSYKNDRTPTTDVCKDRL